MHIGTRAILGVEVTDWLSFSDLLRTNVVWDGIVHNLGLQLLYVAIFGSLAWARFTTKDVLA